MSVCKLRLQQKSQQKTDIFKWFRTSHQDLKRIKDGNERKGWIICDSLVRIVKPDLEPTSHQKVAILQQFQMKNLMNPDEGKVNWSQAAVCRGDMMTDGSSCNTPVCLLSNVIPLSTAAQVIAKMNQFSVWIHH